MRRRNLWIAIVAAVVGAGIIGLAGPSLYWGVVFWDANREAEAEMGPHVRELRDEIQENVTTGRWGERVSIEPKLIVESLERGAAEAKLQDLKFEKPDETFRQPSPPIVKNVETYRQFLGGLPCNTELQLYLRFDKDDRLIEASGAIFEAGCL